MSTKRPKGQLQPLNFDMFRPGMRVLDIGCGSGREMEQLAGLGCDTFGIDICAENVESCRNRGLKVEQASAEQLPYPDETFDGVISQVVLPYTDEARVIREVARVLKPGGIFCHSCHGAGYSLVRFFVDRSWKRRLYHFRIVMNTWAHQLAGFRLPGSFGDTIYQSRRRLDWYYRRCNLSLLHDDPVEDFLGLPIFIYQTIQKESTTDIRPVNCVKAC